MPHCHVADVSAIDHDGSDASPAHARSEMQQLIGACRQIMRDTGVMVELIHHGTKTQGTGRAGRVTLWHEELLKPGRHTTARSSPTTTATGDSRGPKQAKTTGHVSRHPPAPACSASPAGPRSSLAARVLGQGA